MKSTMKRIELNKLNDEELYNRINEIGFAQSNFNTRNEAVLDKVIDSFFSIHMMEADVLNGGFDQFFFNGGYENHCEKAMWGLGEIGGGDFLQLLNNAMVIHSKSKSVERNYEYDSLDDRFCDLDEFYNDDLTQLNKLIVTFLRSNFKEI